MLLINDYSQKFAYRSEVIVDEICSNAVIYGCKSTSDQVEFACQVYPDKMEIQVKDQGGSIRDLERLRIALKNDDHYHQNNRKNYYSDTDSNCLGIEIVRLLSEEIELDIDENNVTTIRVVRKRGIKKSMLN
jgi:anti-sigma regulatory factor (Ser/Thr protein kinase)